MNLWQLLRRKRTRTTMVDVIGSALLDDKHVAEDTARQHEDEQRQQREAERRKKNAEMLERLVRSNAGSWFPQDELGQPRQLGDFRRGVGSRWHADDAQIQGPLGSRWAGRGHEPQ